MTVQGSAGPLHDSAGECRGVAGQAGKCRTVQGSCRATASPAATATRHQTFKVNIHALEHPTSCTVMPAESAITSTSVLTDTGQNHNKECHHDGASRIPLLTIRCLIDHGQMQRSVLYCDLLRLVVLFFAEVTAIVHIHSCPRPVTHLADEVSLGPAELV